ncbi:ATP-grasp domain-containing protein [Streptomyces sp. NRRL S-87]|uniref:ATP-grasp domain-containing protein n=1 Tax=Streptomyces sp. NRRL S-87 TaxID=1463920 RepID=UPI0006920EAE|nr:ATP-grasp domain-containing protein [Streptomyces sp. NRRL S-87]
MQTGPAVLHVGWMPRAVAALGRAGARVTCVVAPADAEAARAAGAAAVVVPQPSNVEGVLAGLARTGQALEDYDVICSVLEFCLVPAAVLAELAGRPRATARGTLAMRDKYLQKHLVREAGVPTAACTVVADLGALDVREVAFPSVLKPLDGGGARHTYVLRDGNSAREYVDRATVGGKGPWLLEEFIDGIEFQVDGIVRDGKIRVLSVSRYLQNLIEVHEGGLVAHVALPPTEYPELYAGIHSLAEDSFAALGYVDGPFHLEVFQEPGGRILFGECAARVGGGRTDDVVELAFGVDLRDEWARAVLDRPTAIGDLPAHHGDAVFGGMNLPGPAGRVRAMPTLDEVLARPGVVRATFDIAPGQVMPDVTDASHLRAGLAVVRGADDREVAARMRDLAAWFAGRVELEPPAAE